jgi:hypothetical protein
MSGRDEQNAAGWWQCLRWLVRYRHELALGIERIGLISLRFPRMVGLLALALAVFSAVGVTRIRINDSLSQLFQSDTPEFRLYQQETRRFPSSEFDVLIVIDGKTLLQRASIEKLRNMATDLQLIDREAPIRARNPGYIISVTSLSAIAARNSAIMIEKLNRGLTIEVVFVWLWSLTSRSCVR